jgi:spermidine synthase
VLVLAALAAGMIASEKITSLTEQSLYADDVILARSTPYQRIVVTRWRDDFRLFLNAHLQFSSRDEYRYHEALVHPVLSALPAPRRVLVLGGGDGMAVREILRYPAIEDVVLVDLDPEMTNLFRNHPELSRLNSGSLQSRRVKVINQDAFVWLYETQEEFDAVIIDFPDPTNFSLGKLYSTAFYRELLRHVREGGLISAQSTSPMFARQSYWCIVETMRAAGWKTHPYHVYVPSFGEWGFVLGARSGYTQPIQVPDGLRFLTPQAMAQMFHFPADMARVDAEPNRLNDQVLVRYYESEWNQVSR